MPNSWNPAAVSVGGYALHEDANIRLLSAMLAREQNLDQFTALNETDQAANELDGGTNTFTLNLKVVSPTPATTANVLRGLEARANGGANQPVLFNQWVRTLVPTATYPVLEFNCPVIFAGLTGGVAGEAYNSDNDWPAETYEEVTALPVTPANVASDVQTATTIDLTWDLDVETYTRHANLDRVAYFNVYRTETTGGPVGDPYVLVSPADGVANNEDPTTSGKVRWQNTGLTASTTYYYVIEAVDQYGMVSAQSTEFSQATTA